MNLPPFRVRSLRRTVGSLAYMVLLSGFAAQCHSGFGVAVFALALYFFVRWIRNTTALSNANRDAINAMNEGKFDEARSILTGVLSAPMDAGSLAVYLNNLAVIAWRSGSLDEAEAIVLAAEKLLAIYPPEPASGLLMELSHLKKLVLLAQHRLDEAETLLRSEEANVRGNTRGRWLRLQSVLLCKRGRYEDAIALLDKNREFLYNCTAGSDLALLEATEAFALDRLGGAFRGAAIDRPPGLPYSENVRKQTDQLLPGAGAFLTVR